MKNSENNKLNEKADILYRFTIMCGDYLKSVRDYGTGDKINMVEIHILTYIADHPGITVTQIASDWHKTKATVSEIVKKLEKRGFIEKRKEGNNAKTLHCHVTELGNMLSLAHKNYDMKTVIYNTETLRREFTEQEMEIFYKIMDRFTELILIPELEKS
ncbi:MAG: MarR family winged helix-turn-helix transcriptional regulator [Lachnospiraceae bacterium]|jgi:DNA-binding MarR family transcriptional regulator